MKTMVALLKGFLLSLGAIALGGLAGLGIAWPQANLAISVLAAGSCIAIAFVSLPAVLAILIVAAPISTFAHLDLRLAEGIPAISLVRLVATFLVLLILLQINAGWRRWPKVKVIDLVVLVTTAGIAFSVGRSVELVRSSQVFFDSYLIPFLMYFLARNVIRDRIWLNVILGALVVVGVYLAVLTTIEMTTGHAFLSPGGDIASSYSQHLGRSTVIFGNSAISGALLAIVFPIALILLMEATGPLPKVLVALALVIIAVGLFYTYTRAAWVTSFFSLLLLQLFYPRLRRVVLPLLVLVGIAAIALWGDLSRSVLFTERITSQGPLEGRSSLLDLGFNFFRQSPVFGIGFDNFRQITKLWNMTDIENTHNSFLFILVSAGLVGLLPYVSVFFLILKETITGVRWLASAGRGRLLAPLCCAMIAYLGNALVIDVVSAPYVSMVFFILVGCHLGLLEKLRSEEVACETELAWEGPPPLPASA